MNKKFRSFGKGIMLAACCLCVLQLAACGTASEPEATIPPGITNPDGGVVSTNPNMLEGRVVKLSKNSITLMVQKVEWKMSLSEKAQAEVARFAELDMPIKEGGFVIAYYENKEDGGREVTRLEHLNAN
ncbi:MAG: hypothetical protein ACI4QW_00270 [Clostridia bacterium]